MCSYPKSLPVWQVFHFSVLLPVLVCLALPLAAQHRLMIPSPLETGEKLGVLGVEDTLCVVDLGFAIESVAANSYYFDEAVSYADGFLEINRPVGHVIREKRKTTFDFSVKVKPSRDYEDCFVVLQLHTLDGREFLLPFEVEDLRANKTQLLHVAPELAFDDLNKGFYDYHFFSAGEEIYFAPTQLQLGKNRPRPIVLDNAGNRDPELAIAPEGTVSEKLAYMVSGEEALVAVGVNDNGYSVDHTVLSESSPSVGRFALNLVKNARFKPGSEDGYFARKDLLLRVRFDSRGHYRLWEE